MSNDWSLLGIRVVVGGCNIEQNTETVMLVKITCVDLVTKIGSASNVINCSMNLCQDDNHQ